MRQTEDNRMKWVTIWGNAPSMTECRPEQYAKNITLTYPLHVPFAGTAVRLRFSNRYGKEPVTLSGCAVLQLAQTGIAERIVYPELEEAAAGHSGAADERRREAAVYPLTDMPVRIPAGGEYESEPVALSCKQNDILAVQFYLKDFTPLSSGVYTSGIDSGGFFTEGNAVGIAALDGTVTMPTPWNYLLTDVLLQTEATAGCRTVICYGDSITAQDWPDVCCRAFLHTEGNRIAVIRKAVSGTRVLRQYECSQYRSYGIKGAVRFPHECRAEGASAVLIQHGINDIIHPVGTAVNPFRPWSDLPTAEELIAGYREYIRIARAHGLKVWFGTLLPIQGWRTYSECRDTLRNAVNDWIRTTDEIDGIVDFDALVRDAAEPLRFAEGFDSGDHLHPSKAAYRAMGEFAYQQIGILDAKR